MKNKTKLASVTLLGIDCVDIDRLRLAADICQERFEFADVKLLTSLPVKKDSRIVKIPKVASVEEYSSFMIAELSRFVDTDHVLVIQHDGFILNPDAWSDEFLEYDYIGAPWMTDEWSVSKFDFPQSLLGIQVVGNGGFSLRSKRFVSLCQKLARDGVFKTYHPEDVVLCVYYRKLLEDNGIKFAPIELAERFSYESGDKIGDAWNDQFGFHGLSWTDISRWLATHPEYAGRIINDVEGHNRRLREQLGKAAQKS